MPTLNILGREREVRGLTPPELSEWNSYISRLFADTYWPELYESIKGLPPALQQVIVSRSPLPDKLNRLQYFRCASRVESVRLLVKKIVLDGGVMVTEGNAVEIFWALQPLILNKPTVLEGGEGLSKLKERVYAGLS